MCPKSSRQVLSETHETRKLGIPKVLSQIRHEKITEVVPVKVQASLKLFLTHHAEPSVSTWIRQLILTELRREAHEEARV